MGIKEYGNMQSNLSNQSIDAISEWLLTQMARFKLQKRSGLRIRLLIEEMLLRVQEALGEQTEVLVSVEKSFFYPFVKIEIPGKAFNPLSETNAELGEWNSSLQTAVGLTPKYSYNFGKNTLKLKIPVKETNPCVMIFSAIAVGILLGFAGYYIFPDIWQGTINTYLLTPAYNLWIRMLNAISGPIIFFTVITTMLNTKRIDKQGGHSTNVVVRYFVFSFIIASSGVVVALPLMQLVSSQGWFSTNIMDRLLEYGREIIPSDIIEPFKSANTPQLIFVAFVLGAALLSLGSQVKDVKTLTRQINMVGLKLAAWMSKLVPLFTGLFLFLEIANKQTDTLKGMWKPLALSVGASVGMMIITLLYVSLRLKVSPLVIGKKVEKPFFTALKTASLDESFEHTKRSCTSYLGIDKTYTNVSLPQGLVLYMPMSAIGTLIFTMYAARIYQVEIDLFWIISAIIFAVLLFVATPPVPGANLLAYVVFFQWLGIPAKALMDAMIFDIVFGILAGAGNQFLLQLEMVLQARKSGMLNHEVLAKPLPKKKKAKAKS